MKVRCAHFVDGKCAHPEAPTKQCVLHDLRVNACGWRENSWRARKVVAVKPSPFDIPKTSIFDKEKKHGKG
jgi:hypothetical protein